MVDPAGSVTVEVVTPGSADDPFTAQASATDPASSPSPDGGPGAAGSQVDPEKAPDGTAVDPSKTSSDPANPPQIDPAIAAALAEIYQKAKADVEAELVPRIQSGYDRRTQVLERRLEAQQEAAAEQQARLREEIRQTKLTGLSDEDKAKLQAQWNLEDRQAEVEALSVEVDAYYKSVFIADCIQQFPELELTPEDLDQFDTPEDIEAAIKDALIESYRSGALQAPTDTPAAQGADKAAPTAAAPAAKPGPAGLHAQTDAGGGAAAPTVPKFDNRPGKEAMAANINQGWETVQIRRQ